MSTNSFEAGKHEDATEASQISTFDGYGCKTYFKTNRGLTLIKDHARKIQEIESSR